MATSNWGGSWTVQDRSSLGISMGVSYGISCPSSSDCVIVGVGALTTTNGGTTWQKHSVPGELNVVSCPSASLCVAEANDTSAVPANTSTVIATSGDGGVSWQEVETVNGQVLGSLSCPTTAVCLSVGGGIVEKTTDGGSTWTEAQVQQASNLEGVSCATGTTDCVAVGWSGSTESSSTAIILKTVDDGSTWTEASLPTP